MSIKKRRLIGLLLVFILNSCTKDNDTPLDIKQDVFNIPEWLQGNWTIIDEKNEREGLIFTKNDIIISGENEKRDISYINYTLKSISPRIIKEEYTKVTYLAIVYSKNPDMIAVSFDIRLKDNNGRQSIVVILGNNTGQNTQNPGIYYKQ